MGNKIKLRAGYQRKLIEKTKVKKQLTWKEFGALLNINWNYLKNDLRNERLLLHKDTYKKICELSNCNFDNHILKILPLYWGQQKGGRISKSKPRKPQLLTTEKSDELAEIIGIMLGDGNIWSNKGYYYVRICGHANDDRKYLQEHVKPLFNKIFGVSLYEYWHKTNKELFLTIGNKDLVYTLNYFGLPSGSKKVNNVGIPKWIFQSNSFLKSCIRGLIDTDGSVCPITGRKYPYIWFSSVIPNLRNSFSEAMNLLGYNIGKWTGNPTPQTFIGKKSHINKYFNDIGFNNPKHLKYFKNALVV